MEDPAKKINGSAMTYCVSDPAHYVVGDSVRDDMKGKSGFVANFTISTGSVQPRICTTLDSAREYIRIMIWRLKRAETGNDQFHYRIIDLLTRDEYSMFDNDEIAIHGGDNFSLEDINRRLKPLPEPEIDGMLKYGVVVAQRPPIRCTGDDPRWDVYQPWDGSIYIQKT